VEGGRWEVGGGGEAAEGRARGDVGKKDEAKMEAARFAALGALGHRKLSTLEDFFYYSQKPVHVFTVNRRSLTPSHSDCG
jgi:hypothetical protein